MRVRSAGEGQHIAAKVFRMTFAGQMPQDRSMSNPSVRIWLTFERPLRDGCGGYVQIFPRKNSAHSYEMFVVNEFTHGWAGQEKEMRLTFFETHYG